MQVEAKIKLKSITIYLDEVKNGKMSIEGDIVIGGMSLFGSKPFLVKLPISDEFDQYIKREIESNVGKIMQDKLNGAD